MDSRVFLEKCLRKVIEEKVTDLHLKSGVIPRIRRAKELVPTDMAPSPEKLLEELLTTFATPYQREVLKNSKSVDFAFNFDELGRFRANVFYQGNELAWVIRRVRVDVPDFEDLKIPSVLKKVAMEERGLVLISGPTSSGKTTTIAAMINYINENRACRIITIEDPIEYLHRDKKALISQREIGQDADSFVQALHFVVRQDPDVIVIGEIRDLETFQTALAASETGRLVISTVHGKNVSQSFDRVLGFYPREQHEGLFVELAYNLKCVTSQRLLRVKDTVQLVPAFEILLMSPAANKLVREGRPERLGQAMQMGKQEGMQMLNQSLLELLEAGLITREDALAASDHPQTLEMNMKGIFLDETAGGILGND